MGCESQLAAWRTERQTQQAFGGCSSTSFFFCFRLCELVVTAASSHCFQSVSVEQKEARMFCSRSRAGVSFPFGLLVSLVEVWLWEELHDVNTFTKDADELKFDSDIQRSPTGLV